MMSIRVLADLAAARKAWPLASGPLGSTGMVTDTTRPGLRLQGVDGQEPQGVVGWVGDLGPLDVEVDVCYVQGADHRLVRRGELAQAGAGCGQFGSRLAAEGHDGARSGQEE